LQPYDRCFVTSEELAMIVRGSILDHGKPKCTLEKKLEDSSEKESSRKDSVIETAMYYENFNHCVVVSKQKDSFKDGSTELADDQIHFVFKLVQKKREETGSAIPISSFCLIPANVTKIF
jgi:hypothetical protein